MIEIIIGVMIAGVIIAAIIGIIGIKDQTKKISYLRFSIQTTSLVVGFLGLLGLVGLAIPLLGTDLLPEGLSVPAYACYYPSGRTATCYLWQLQAYFYPFFNLQFAAISLGLIIVMSIVLGRFWCGWICPFGFIQDLITRARKYLHIGYSKLSEKLNVALHQLRYVILTVAMIIVFLTASENLIGIELVGTKYGQIGFALSVPFCQVCPLKPLSMFLWAILGLQEESWQFIFSMTPPGLLWTSGMWFTSINLIILALITIGVVKFRRFWCRFCPLGGIIALFNRYVPFKWASFVRLNKEEVKCTKCGICERVCAPQVTEVYEEKGGDVTSSRCVLCFRCVEMCPEEGCLKINLAGKPIYTSKNWLKGLK